MKGYIKISRIETSLKALSSLTKSIPQASMKTIVPLVSVNHATRLFSLVQVGEFWNYALEAIINCIIIILGSLSIPNNKGRCVSPSFSFVILFAFKVNRNYHQCHL